MIILLQLRRTDRTGPTKNIPSRVLQAAIVQCRRSYGGVVPGVTRRHLEKEARHAKHFAAIIAAFRLSASRMTTRDRGRGM